MIIHESLNGLERHKEKSIKGLCFNLLFNITKSTSDLPIRGLQNCLVFQVFWFCQYNAFQLFLPHQYFMFSVISFNSN